MLDLFGCDVHVGTNFRNTIYRSLERSLTRLKAEDRADVLRCLSTPRPTDQLGPQYLNCLIDPPGFLTEMVLYAVRLSRPSTYGVSDAVHFVKRLVLASPTDQPYTTTKFSKFWGNFVSEIMLT